MTSYTEICPNCGNEMHCLAGSSAHPLNWYCENPNCGYEAWRVVGSRNRRELREQVLALTAENRALKAQLAAVYKIQLDHDVDGHGPAVPLQLYGK